MRIMITNRELIAELRKPGRVYMPVVAPHDVVHMEIVKAALIFLLKDQPPDEPAIWCFYGDDKDRTGDRWLDVQS
jgi:hypothetical protein